jgi:predicted ATPase
MTHLTVGDDVFLPDDEDDDEEQQREESIPLPKQEEEEEENKRTRTNVVDEADADGQVFELPREVFLSSVCGYLVHASPHALCRIIMAICGGNYLPAMRHLIRPNDYYRMPDNDGIALEREMIRSFLSPMLENCVQCVLEAGAMTVRDAPRLMPYLLASPVEQIQVARVLTGYFEKRETQMEETTLVLLAKLKMQSRFVVDGYNHALNSEQDGPSGTVGLVEVGPRRSPLPYMVLPSLGVETVRRFFTERAIGTACTYTESQFLCLRFLLRTTFASMGRCAWYPQREAVDHDPAKPHLNGCEYRDRVILMGAPGSGKTTIVRAFANIVEAVTQSYEERPAHALDHCCRSGGSVVRVAAATANAASVLTSAASTGRSHGDSVGNASLNSRALTMHSAFGIPVSSSVQDFFRQAMRKSFLKQLKLACALRKPIISMDDAARRGMLANTVNVAAIVLDETSMMSEAMYLVVQLSCLAEQFQLAQILKMLPFDTVKFPLPFILPNGKTFPRHYAAVRKEVLSFRAESTSSSTTNQRKRNAGPVNNRSDLMPQLASLGWHVPTQHEESSEPGPGLPMVALMREAVECWRAYFTLVVQQETDCLRFNAGQPSVRCISPPIVLVGDFAQLPTVSTEKFPTSPFWTHAPSVKAVRPCILSQNVRQASDPTLLKILSLMRSGESNAACQLFNHEIAKRKLIRRRWSSDLLRYGPVLTPRRDTMARINEEYLKRMRPNSRWACTVHRVSHHATGESVPWRGRQSRLVVQTLERMRSNPYLGAIADVITVTCGSAGEEGGSSYLLDGVAVRLRYNYDPERGLYNGAALVLDSIGLFCTLCAKPILKERLIKSSCLEIVPVTEVKAIARSVRISSRDGGASSVEIGHRWSPDKFGSYRFVAIEGGSALLPPCFGACAPGCPVSTSAVPADDDEQYRALNSSFLSMYAAIAWQDRVPPELFQRIVKYAQGECNDLGPDSVQANYVILRLKCPITKVTHLVAADRIDAYSIIRSNVGRVGITTKLPLASAFNLHLETNAARTIHQAQGLTLPGGLQGVGLDRSFEPGMFYVGLSRLTELSKYTAVSSDEVLPGTDEEQDDRGGAEPKLRMPEHVFRVNQNAVQFMRQMENAPEAVGVRGH